MGHATHLPPGDEGPPPRHEGPWQTTLEGGGHVEVGPAECLSEGDPVAEKAGNRVAEQPPDPDHRDQDPKKDAPDRQHEEASERLHRFPTVLTAAAQRCRSGRSVIRWPSRREGRQNDRMEVRPAALADARTIAEIHVRSWQAAYVDQVPDAYLASLSADQREPIWKEILAATDWPRMGALVLVEDPSVVGFTHLAPARDQNASPTTGEVTSIYLAPEVWGLGVVPSHVADTAHGRATDGGVVPVMVVEVQPGGQRPGPLAV